MTLTIQEQMEELLKPYAASEVAPDLMKLIEKAIPKERIPYNLADEGFNIVIAELRHNLGLEKKG